MSNFNTPSDALVTREETYLANRQVCDSFMRGLVAANQLFGTRPKALVSFKHDGATVRNPFWSIHGEDAAVDPLTYYGKDFVGSQFLTLALANVGKLAEYEADLDEGLYDADEEGDDHPVYPGKGVTINVYGADVKVERK